MIIAHQKSISYVPTTNNGFEAATCLDLPSVPGYDPASLLGWRLSYGYLAGKDKWPRLNGWGNVVCQPKMVASESASAIIFGDLGVGCFACSLYASIRCNWLLHTFYHSTHHQAEPLLCGEGYDWYDLWPCKTDHKIRKVQRCSSFACLGGFLIVLFFRVEIPYDFHFFTHELSKNPTTVASGHQSGVSSKVQGSVVICKGLW